MMKPTPSYARVLIVGGLVAYLAALALPFFSYECDERQPFWSLECSFPGYFYLVLLVFRTREIAALSILAAFATHASALLALATGALNRLERLRNVAAIVVLPSYLLMVAMPTPPDRMLGVLCAALAAAVAFGGGVLGMVRDHRERRHSSVVG